MKKICLALLIILLPMMVGAEDFIVTEAQYVVISGNTLDTLGRTMITPDSIRIVVADSAGTELFDAWFESADAQCALNGDVITFFDQWEDINGAASVGTFSIMATIASDADNNIDVYSNQNYTLRGVATTTEATFADIVSILANQTLIIDTVNGIIDTLQLQDDIHVLIRDTAYATIDTLQRFTKPATDTLQGIIDSIQNLATLTDIADEVSDSIFFATFIDIDGVAGSVGDSMKGWGATAAGGDDSPSGWDATDSAIVRAAVADTGQALGWDAGVDASPSAWNATDSAIVRAAVADTGTDLAWEGVADVSALALEATVQAHFDTLKYDFGIWVDAAAANTNTVVGTDGTENNPVSTLTAARTLADALGFERYYFLNNSSFTLAATHENWEFFSIAHENTINLGSQDVDNSAFHSMRVTGTQGGTGLIHLTDCDISVLRDFNGEALFSWLEDTLVMDNNSTIEMGNCYSHISGAGAPVLDFNVASNNAVFRNYSGGLNIMGMSSNDTMTIEGNGNVIIDASCTSANITIRGGFTVTDNGTTTNLTHTATTQYVVDSLQAILDSIQLHDDWVAQNAYFDTLIYDGPDGLGIYLDSAAANTNTTFGTDGTAKNPVSTLAAARTLADALGHKRYYLINRSTFNAAANDLAAAHQDWEFIGLGYFPGIAFGGQLVDGSMFKNLTVSGALDAGGGPVQYDYCVIGYISANFNGHADNCWLTDTIVVKANPSIAFTGCESAVPGNAAPTIDMSAGATKISIRNYSGGIRVMNGASSDTISIETDGQLIISANNTSIYITARGMMSITDSGTTTNLTQDAVWNRTYVAATEAPMFADSVMDEPMSGHNTANTFGDTLMQIIQQAGIKISELDEDNATIDLDGTTIGTATNLTTNNDKTGYTLSTAGNDAIWEYDTSLVSGAQAFGTMLKDTSAYQGGAGSAPDSTTLSNMLHRIGWGTAKGSGSDSSTLAERDVTAAGGHIDSIAEGDGTGSFTYKAVDTANDIAVQFVSVTAYNTAGNILGIPQLTDGSGFTVWGFTVGDTVIFQTAQNSGWTWEQDDSIITVTNGGIDSTMGYGPSIGTPSGGNECRVFGFVYDIIDTADAMGNIWAYIELVDVANNTCDSTITVPRLKGELTGSDGQFQFDVVRSSCLSDTQYRIWLEWDEGLTDKHKFAAPDQATFKILWQ